MYALANGRNVLGQMQPFLTPTLTPFAPTMPTAAAATPAAGGGERLALVGLTLLYAGMGVTSALFSYGVAKESQSKMVRTTGYILAGVAGLGVLASLIGAGAVTAMAGPKR
jgi:hypothetical protein